LGIGQAEQALLQHRVLAVPQGDGHAKPLPVVAEAGQAILAPAISPATGHLIGEIRPGVAVRAVVFAHRAPLPLTQVRAPFSPVPPPQTLSLKALLFRIHWFSSPLVHGLLEGIDRLRRPLPGVGGNARYHAYIGFGSSQDRLWIDANQH